MSLRVVARLSLLVATLVLAALAVPAVSAGATLYLSPSGSDENACTATLPCRTIARADAVAVEGDRVVIHAGDYGERGVTTTASTAGVTWTGIADEARPRLLGKTRIRGAGSKWQRITWQGPTGDVGGNASECSPGESVVVDIGADSVIFERNEVTGSLGHAGAYVTRGTGISVRGNWVHDNGCSAATAANRDHGVYWHDGAGTVTNNVIERNVARGVQVYPGPATVTVAHNTIVDNGGAGVEPSLRNLVGQVKVANNVIAGNGNVLGSPGVACRTTGASDHLVVSNIFWDNAGGDTTGDTCALTANAHTDPLLVSGDWHLTASSPAIGFGSPTYAVTLDYEGDRRDAAPDAGADEYSAPPPALAP